MKTAEEYWTREYLEYALYRQELALKQAEQGSSTGTQDNTQSPLESQLEGLNEEIEHDNN